MSTSIKLAEGKNQRLNWPRTETEKEGKEVSFAAIDKNEGNTLHSERQKGKTEWSFTSSFQSREHK